MAVLIVSFCMIAALDCEPPDTQNREELFLGNTFFRNEYCRQHMNLSQIRLFAAFAGYIIYDITLIALFKEDSLTPGTQEFEASIHHFLCVLATAASLILGGYLGVLMSATLLTELSTPFVNIYRLLKIHGAAESKLQ